MEKTISYVSLILIVLMIGVYFTREITKSEYRRQFDKIEAIKDTLDEEIKSIQEKLVNRDTLLIKQIQASRKIIQEINKNNKVSTEVINEYDKIINEIIDQI